MMTCNQITLVTKDLVPDNLWLLTKCLESMKIPPEKVSIKRETLSLISLTSKRSRFWINSMLTRYNGNRSRRITSKNLSFYLNKSKQRKPWRGNAELGIRITWQNSNSFHISTYHLIRITWTIKEKIHFISKEYNKWGKKELISPRSINVSNLGIKRIKRSTWLSWIEMATSNLTKLDGLSSKDFLANTPLLLLSNLKNLMVKKKLPMLQSKFLETKLSKSVLMRS